MKGEGPSESGNIIRVDEMKDFPRNYWMCLAYNIEQAKKHYHFRFGKRHQARIYDYVPFQKYKRNEELIIIYAFEVVGAPNG